MTDHSKIRRSRRWKVEIWVLAVMVVGLSVAACGGTADRSVSGAGSPTQIPLAPAIVTSSMATTVGPGTPVARVGEPADDGAWIVAVDSPEPRFRDLTIDSPTVGVVKVRLLVPDRFDTEPSTRWPVLFLLHGAHGSHLDWTELTDVEDLTGSADIVVVMPDAGEVGFYSDWWNNGLG